MAENGSPARRLWQVYEPLHAVAYFAPETAEAMRGAGLKGFWMGYFGSRLAPMGAVDAAAAGAVCFPFAPRRVQRALPDAWRLAPPETVLNAYLGAVERVLERALPPGAQVARLAGLLERAVEGCSFEGRPLAAAWAAVERPASAVLRLWLAATILREHRGDGHTMALAHAGLTGLEASVTHVATGAVPREPLQSARGWTEEEWEEAERGLAARGLLDAEGRPTAAGEAVRRTVEEDTDRLAAGPVTALGEAGLEEAVALATPLARHLLDTGAVPAANPIGLPRP
ncbi:hypothetical protein RM780_04450 [Streptomyces sp. DSM 44917]|uniref:SalK n=1 Tax=Streptomyces boetiae TaxID=3075541 RepID=A0ABU2L3S0_9ACTN|nr:hypothetical protein [Streptomyces sp. DSM 44917]MDT0306212.1 hypothetical protein [Streptomyces sp. DSM 44917]